MTLVEQIIAFSGTAVGSLLIGKWLSRKKDELEVTLKQQTFYKTLIEDITKQHEKEKQEITKLKDKVTDLTRKINKLLESHAQKDKIIEEQRENLKRWENNCVRLENVCKEKDILINKLANNED